MKTFLLGAAPLGVLIYLFAFHPFVIIYSLLGLALVMIAYLLGDTIETFKKDLE